MRSYPLDNNGMIITITQGSGHTTCGLFVRHVGGDRVTVRVGKKLITGRVVE